MKIEQLFTHQTEWIRQLAKAIEKKKSKYFDIQDASENYLLIHDRNYRYLIEYYTEETGWFTFHPSWQLIIQRKDNRNIILRQGCQKYGVTTIEKIYFSLNELVNCLNDLRTIINH